MRECEITVNDQFVGLIILDDGQAAGKAVKGYEGLIGTILMDDVLVDDERISREEDPEAWFNGLPIQYHGSRIYATMRQPAPAADSVLGLVRDSLLR